VNGPPPSQSKVRPLQPQIRIKTAATFVAEYVPLSYAIEPIVRSSSLYTLTAKTGTGKTAWLVMVALAVATDRKEILGLDVDHGRVCYIACENADDVRMRLMIAAYALNIDLQELGAMLTIIDVRRKPEEIFAAMRTAESAGEFRLIIVDTFAAAFDGNDINDNVQAGEFIRRLRPLTGIRGLPSVLVAAHPVKNASEDNLLPYGGGAILNEVDGNLTLWKKPETGFVNLHWQGKLRGLEFQPRPFRFELLCSPDIVDAKGRQVQLPVMHPCDEGAAEAREAAEVDRKTALLKIMFTDPKGTVRSWADQINVSSSVIGRILQGFGKAKWAEKDATDKWRLTNKGIAEAKNLL